jgi:hypothetical protein
MDNNIDSPSIETDETSEARREFIRLTQEAAGLPFWDKVFMKYIENQLIFLDDLYCREKDPWLRYGYVEAYKWMREVKFYFEDLLTAGEQPALNIKSFSGTPE